MITVYLVASLHILVVSASPGCFLAMILTTSSSLGSSDVRKFKETKKQFDKVREDMEISLVKNAQAPRHKPHEVEEATGTLTIARKCFRHLALDYVLQVGVCAPALAGSPNAEQNITGKLLNNLLDHYGHTSTHRYTYLPVHRPRCLSLRACSTCRSMQRALDSVVLDPSLSVVS